jgi:hypothetical protein
MGCGAGDPPNAKTIKKERKKNQKIFTFVLLLFTEICDILTH